MTKSFSLEKALPYIFIVGGIVGIIASFILSLDNYHYLQNPSFQPSCNLNPVVSCGTVMKTWQANAFGFPNPWIGLVSFSAIAAIGVSLLAGAKFKRWFWLGIEGGILTGLGFAFWLLYQSIYHIGALCPYCLASDVATITIFWYTTLYLIGRKIIRVPKACQKPAAFIRRHHLDSLLLIFIILIAIILKHFWYYYGKHL